MKCKLKGPFIYFYVFTVLFNLITQQVTQSDPNHSWVEIGFVSLQIKLNHVCNSSSTVNLLKYHIHKYK